MKSDSTPPATIDDYIAGFPTKVRKILERIRATIQKAAPDAVEVISYRMPAFKLDGRILVYFAGWNEHIGLYPPVNDAALKPETAPYEGPKGNLQFPLDERMPYGLITRIVKSRIRQNAEKRAAKKRGTKKPSS